MVRDGGQQNAWNRHLVAPPIQTGGNIGRRRRGRASELPNMTIGQVLARNCVAKNERDDVRNDANL